MTIGEGKQDNMKCGDCQFWRAPESGFVWTHGEPFCPITNRRCKYDSDCHCEDLRKRKEICDNFTKCL